MNLKDEVRLIRKIIREICKQFPEAKGKVHVVIDYQDFGGLTTSFRGEP